MVKINGNDIYRDSQKIGYISDNKYIKSHDGKILGHFDQKYIYDEHGNRWGHIQGRYLYSENGNQSKINIDQINETIEGGVLPQLGKCAIYMLLGN